MDRNDFHLYLNQKDRGFNNDPEILKILIDKIGDEAHRKIHINLLGELIKNYSKLTKELEEKVEEITRLSETDQLTKVYNRLKFINELEKETNRANRYENKLSLIMMDIDHFKHVNDTYGHDAGDMVLIAVAETLALSIRKTDVLARWGGEEFMILVPNTDLESAKNLAEKTRKKIESRKLAKVKNVTASFGVTEYQRDEKIESFTKRVDEALYAAKNSGRNTVYCLPHSCRDIRGQ